jgi:Spy/CpxP family protein refolding chaperone
MKRLLSLSIAALLLTAAVVMAQTPRHGHFGHMKMAGPDGEHGAQMHERMVEHLSKALELSDAQKASAQQIHEETMKKVEPLFEQQRALHEQVETALEKGSDAATVGSLVISSYKNRQAIKAAHEEAMKDFEALLTPDQLTKLQSLKESHERHGGPHHAE